MEEKNNKSQKLSPLHKMVEKLPGVSVHVNFHLPLYKIGHIGLKNRLMDMV